MQVTANISQLHVHVYKFTYAQVTVHCFKLTTVHVCMVTQYSELQLLQYNKVW